MTPPPSPSLHVALQLQMAGPCPAVLQSPYQVCSGVDLNHRLVSGVCLASQEVTNHCSVHGSGPTVVVGVQHVKLGLW